MSKIKIESELMKNQKAAAVLPAQSAFASHPSQSGSSIFFAISSVGVFNLIQEQNGKNIGWAATDLCSGLSAQHQNKAITAKTFATTQNYTDGTISVAVVVQAAGDNNSYLYVATGLSNVDQAPWMKDFAQINWVARPYDDATHPLTTVTITNVYLTPQQKSTGDTQLICEVNINNSLQNYTVNLSGSNAWAQLQTAENFGSVLDQAIGKASASPFAGLYQLTNLNGSIGLNFVPMQSFFGPPTVIKLIAPDGATKIATLPADDQNNTNLFVAANSAIYLFQPAQQTNAATGVVILQNSLIAGLQDFYAHQNGQQTILWGLDQQGQVFYTKCIKGQETVTGAWSVPIPIFDNAERISSYVNATTGAITIFVHSSDQNIVQLTQDITNSLWQQRNILLPPPDVNTVVEYNTYTSHLLLTDDNNLPLVQKAVTITSVNQCSVYINDTYHLLSPTIPIQITTDGTGNINIVQETQTLGAVCYKVAVDGVSMDVNPMSKLLTTISAIKTGDQLGKVQVDNGNGTSSNLVGSTVTSTQKDATASALQNFVQVSSNLPADGSVKKPASISPRNAALPAAFVATPDTIWGVSFKDDWKYHAGQESMQHLGLSVQGRSMAMANAAAPLGNIWDAIETAAGDLWNWLKHAFEEVTQFFVKVVDDVYHFFIEIGGAMYRAVVACINDIVQAVEFVLNKIAVAIEDMVKWLGFIFNWGDIVRTHRVLKNIFKQYLNQSIGNLDSYKGAVKDTFTEVEKYVAAWAGITANIPPGLQNTSRNSSAASSDTQGMNSPQSNWGISHAKSNASAANTDTQSPLGDIEALLKPLLDLLETEKDIFKGAFKSFQTDIIDKIDQMSFLDVIKAIIGIIANLLLETVENLLVTAIDLLIALANGIMDILEAKINIPVITWLYKKATNGDDLTLLDLTCLIAAIPVTIVYKIIAEDVPFPDNPTTTKLYTAPDFTTIKSICNANAPVAAPMARALVAAPTTTPPPKTLNQILVLSSGIAAAVGAIGVSVFGPLKTKFPDTKVFSLFNGMAYIPYVLPDIIGQIPDLQNKKWWAITNNVIADLCIIKAMVDMCVGFKKVPSEGWNSFSPWWDFGANIAWEVPTVAAALDEENNNTIGMLNYWAGTCFDCSGILSPILADDDEPVTWGIAVTANAVFNAGYGAMSCAASVLYYKQTNP